MKKKSHKDIRKKQNTVNSHTQTKFKHLMMMMMMMRVAWSVKRTSTYRAGAQTV
jgi:hypothetical protein